MSSEMSHVLPEECEINSMFQCLIDRHQEEGHSTSGHCARANKCAIKPEHFGEWNILSENEQI